tara:strand:- start:895 stop:1146 length:252 start_codon:yes stop_codon:yes gene_type:complete
VIDKQLFQQFIGQFDSLFSPAENTLASEVRQQIHSAMMMAFSRLDLVTREEFDAQNAVLMRSREKIDQLEQQLATIAAKLDDA